MITILYHGLELLMNYCKSFTAYNDTSVAVSMS